MATIQEARRDIVIAADGDMDLTLPRQTFIRVSSSVLMAASPVFKGMLSPRFKEGHALQSSTGIFELSLPDDDDDPDAMEILCTVLHAQDPTKLIQKPSGYIALSTGAILNLVIVTDKYACGAAVKWIGECVLIRRLKDLERISETMVVAEGNLAAAAHLFGLPHCFALFTRRLVLRRAVCDLAVLQDEQSSEYLPTKFIGGLSPIALSSQVGVVANSLAGMLEEQGNIARKTIVDEINNMAVKSCTSHNRRCHGMLERHIFSGTGNLYITSLSSEWPPDWDSTTIHKMLKKIYLMPDTPLGGRFNCGHSSSITVPSFQFQCLAQDVSAAAGGLCLMCAKQDQPQSACKHMDQIKAIDPTFDF